MGLKPARIFREIKGPAYTRREFIRGVPGIKVAQFDMGNPKGDFDLSVALITKEDVQIRHNAIEAMRVAANKYLQRSLGRGNYHLKIKVYPHHVLRWNPVAIGHHADRYSDGMRRAFGKPIGTAARVKKGKDVLLVRVKKEHLEVAKEALRRAAAKLPCRTKIVIDEGEN